MAKNVYPLPLGLHMDLRVTPQYRVQSEVSFDGGLLSQTELQPRFMATLTGTIHGGNRVAFETFVDRLSGGIGLAGLWDQMLRRQLGWCGAPAIHTSGTEYWRASGDTSAYANETTSPYRTADVTGSGSSGATSLDLTGLLADEPIVAGAPIRIGNYRHIIASAVTANGSGEATVTLARPLRANVSGTVTLPGDSFVGDLMEFEAPNFTPAGFGDFKAKFRQVFSTEVTGGFTWVV